MNAVVDRVELLASETETSRKEGIEVREQVRWSSVGSPRRVSSGLEGFSDFGVNNDNCNPALLVKRESTNLTWLAV